tara:strand:- start:963 stop:1685 length:723 start_codon:yes stop_codon:yes gene_type:complete
MKFIVPSYQRATEIQEKTLKYLLSQGVPTQSIYIVVREDDEQIEQYRSIKDINLIETSVKGIGRTHNFITDWAEEGEFIVEMDDDMIGLVDEKRQNKDFIDTCCEMKKVMTEKGASYGGTYVCDNILWMARCDNYTFDLKYLLGCLRFRFVRKEIVLETNYAEDFENSILHFIRDGLIVKNNHIAPKTKNYSKGGCDGDGRNLVTEKTDKEFLANKYPKYCKLFQRKNERWDLKLIRRPK